MNKTQLNYWIDVVIAAAFIGSASSGLVFLLPLSGSSTVFGVTYATWDTVHTWSSLAMIAGVLAHLVLHWKWIVHMTKKNLGLKRATAVATTNGALSRRDFLHVAGFSILTAAVSGTMLGNYYSQRKETDNDVTEVEPTPNTTTETEAETSIPLLVVPTPTTGSNTTQTLTVACSRGITYDPYPGRCRHYRDSNGDGYCDYSIPSA